MIEYLLGTPTVEKILFYILINKKCYPSQLKSVFHSSLFTFQKALAKLEAGGLLVSFKEGKTSIYQFNPRYPFLPELIKFLEKVYQFYPQEIREKYYEPPVRKRPRRTGKPL